MTATVIFSRCSAGVSNFLEGTGQTAMRFLAGRPGYQMPEQTLRLNPGTSASMCVCVYIYIYIYTYIYHGHKKNLDIAFFFIF